VEISGHEGQGNQMTKAPTIEEVSSEEHDDSQRTNKRTIHGNAHVLIF